MTFKLIFGAPKDVTNPGQDGIQYEFPFTLVNKQFIGAPEENSKTQVHRIIVPISRTGLAGWALKGNELIRVLFEYGKRHVEECVRADELPATEETIRYPEITPDTHPETSCPFDAGAIPWPKGVQQFVEQHRS